MRVFYVVLGVALAVAVALPGSAQAGLLNAGFEATSAGIPTGANWVANFPGSGSAFIKGSHDGSSHPAYPADPNFYGPPEGSWFLELKADGANFPQFTYQVADFTAGEWVAGVAAFDGRDLLNNDWASVDIFAGDVGASIQGNPNFSTGAINLWYRDEVYLAGSGLTGGPLADSPWEHWQYQIPAAGKYTVVYRVNNTTNGSLNSYALFDTAQAIPPVVPEAGTCLLFGLGLGLAGLGYSRRRTK